MRKTTIVSLLLVLVMLAGLFGAHNAVSLYAGLAQWIPAALTLSKERGAKLRNATSWVTKSQEKEVFFASERKKWHEVSMSTRLSCPALITPSTSYPSLQGAQSAMEQLRKVTEVERKKEDHLHALRYALSQYTVACQFLFHCRGSEGLSIKRVMEGLPLLDKALLEIEGASERAKFAPDIFHSGDVKQRLVDLIAIFPLVEQVALREKSLLPSLPAHFSQEKKFSTIEVTPAYLKKRCDALYPSPRDFQNSLQSALSSRKSWEDKVSQLEKRVGAVKGVKEAVSPSLSLILKSIYSLQAAFLDILLVTLVPRNLYELFKEECLLRQRIICLVLRWQQKDIRESKGRPAIELSEIGLSPAFMYDPISGKRTTLLVETRVETRVETMVESSK